MGLASCLFVPCHRAKRGRLPSGNSRHHKHVIEWQKHGKWYGNSFSKNNNHSTSLSIFKWQTATVAAKSANSRLSLQGRNLISFPIGFARKIPGIWLLGVCSLRLKNILNFVLPGIHFLVEKITLKLLKIWLSRGGYSLENTTHLRNGRSG